MSQIRNIIVPEHIQRKLEKSAQAHSRSSWEIADCALEVFNAFKQRKACADQLFLEIDEGDVWRAISHYAGRSAARVRGLWFVAERIPRWLRDMYEDRWEFGYFEKIAGTPYDMGEVFDFLEQYMDGSITHPLPGRKLGVGEFMLIFETQIYGKNRDYPDQDHLPIDAAQLASNQVSFQSLIQHIKRIKRQLWMNREKPNVCRVIEITDELEELLPMVMLEMGIDRLDQPKIQDGLLLDKTMQ